MLTRVRFYKLHEMLAPSRNNVVEPLEISKKRVSQIGRTFEIA